MNLNAATMAELIPTLSVEIPCANYINNLTQTYTFDENLVPNNAELNEVKNTLRLYATLANQGFLGGDCGVDFEMIANDNETIAYLEANDLIWEPDQREYSA